MSSRRELSEIVRLALPMMAAQGGLMLMGVVDTLIVGHVSSREMAAVSLGNNVIGVVFVFNIGVAMGIEPLVSQAIGAGEVERARAWLWQGVYVTGIIAVPVTVVAAMTTLSFEPLGIAQALAERASAFVWARLPGVLLSTAAYSCFRAYFASIGKPRPVLIAVLFGNVLNALGDWVLVFGKLGAPAMGGAGAGLSTSISTTAMAILLALAARSPHRDAKVVKPLLSEMTKVARLGWPIGLQICAEVGIFAVVSALIGRLGEGELAGHQVALTLASLSYMTAVGIANATTSRVGFHVGAGNAKMARRVGFLGIGAGALFMGCCGSMFFIFRTPLAELFLPTDPAAQTIAAALLTIAAAFSIFDGVQTVSAGALRGAGDTYFSFYANIGAYWIIALPVSLYLGRAESLGTAGYWWGLTAGLAIVATVLLLRFRALSKGDIARVDATVG